MKTIVLIHGWDNKNYSRYGTTDAWHNRKKLVDELSLHFNIVKLNLPGFSGEPEPLEPWHLEDFAKHFQNFLTRRGIEPDLVLGYSFGGAVATKWKHTFQPSTKLVLVSPAICRAYKRKTWFQKTFSLKKYLPKQLSSILRDMYMKKIGNEFFTEGTKFLRETYLNIVPVDLSNELMQIPPEDLLIIFGAQDIETPPTILLEKIEGHSLNSKIVVFEDGDHDIGGSHYGEISRLVYKDSLDEYNTQFASKIMEDSDLY